jgi:2-polyprenyl-3-methyl-5-hydroxy-6-metoxy-1,4-benzoquinol methylase
MNDYRLRFYDTLPLRSPSRSISNDLRLTRAIKFVAENVDQCKRYNLLDIGFANLEFLEHMTTEHRQIDGFGCDISSTRVNAAIERGLERVQLKVVDFNECRSAYPSSFFDFILAGEIIEHLENTDNLVVECSRCLKSGGYLIITTPNLAAWYERILLLCGMEPFMAEVAYSSRIFGKRFLYRLARKKESAPIGHLRLFTPAALRELCQYHGLVLIEHSGYYTWNLFLNRWISSVYPNLAQGVFMVFRKP